MKKSSIKAVVAVMLMGMLLGLFSGCIFSDGVKDGPGMVNYPGILLQALLGDWQETGDGGYFIKFWEDMTFTLGRNEELLLINAQLTLHTDSTLTDEYSEFDVNPSEFTDRAGNTAAITKASHENGTVTLVLTAADGKETTIAFRRASANRNIPAPLDGPGMVYYGGYLDDAISGFWESKDGRFELEFNGKFADFTLDGVQLVTMDDGTFVDHSFSEGDDLNERCALFPTGNYLDVNDDPPLTIDEMWYQAEELFLRVRWPDGSEEEVKLERPNE